MTEYNQHRSPILVFTFSNDLIIINKLDNKCVSGVQCLTAFVKC